MTGGSRRLAKWVAIGAASAAAIAFCGPLGSAVADDIAPAAESGYVLTGAAAQPNTYGNDTPTLPFIDKDGTFYVQNAAAHYGADDARVWNFYSGSDFDDLTRHPISDAVNPADPSDSNADTTTRCNNSPTGRTATSAPDTSTYAHPNYCDLTGVWVDPDSGDWYGLVHNEFTPQPFGDGMHYDAIDYAVSRDQGATWTILNQIITSPFSTERDDTSAFPGAIYNYGDGDPRLFVDNASGYFYVYYASRTIAKPGVEGGQSWLQHVARAPISEKMAPSSWSKWYDGAWSEPGVGGQESNIIPADDGGTGYTAPEDDYDPAELGSQPEQVAAGVLPDDSPLAVMNISWSAYLGMYIGTPQNNVAQDTGTKTPQHYYGTTDLATQQWVDLGAVDTNLNGSWYRWLVDSGNLTSSTILGKTFRTYCTFECSTYWNEYVETTIEPASATSLPTAPVDTDAAYTISNGTDEVLVQDGAEAGAAAAGAASSAWKFTSTDDGFFTITNAASGKALSAYGSVDGARAWGAGLSLYPVATSGDDLTAQQWSFQEIVALDEETGTSVGTGEYRLVNRFSNLALSLQPDAEKQAAMAPIRQWEPAAGASDPRPASSQVLTLTPAG